MPDLDLEHEFGLVGGAKDTDLEVRQKVTAVVLVIDETGELILEDLHIVERCVEGYLGGRSAFA